ncbi:DUF4340 domain-containing protein [Paludisphaera mucosa]|uniref:DUF4340 domain-containing protein n=1 Tax=Paludisphaera mucosa TaxID=3030827 RepID=A0ABT6F817_9BACT|nr:DUF4340 domain-containing protein [Paludisphaera mucosa]MDG3003710.1 DUF4340 domain-containing protein [Paludisphaera mucosa]
MRRPRSTYLLIALFFTALLALWGLERAGVLTEAERDRRRDRVLPELIDVNAASVRRLEIDRGAERLVFERVGPKSWRLEPIGVDARTDEVERLIATLKGLRKSPEAGAIDGPAASYGLAPPAATVRVWTGDAGPPDATLEIGRKSQADLFVRSGRDADLAVVDQRMLAVVDRPAVEWRETVLVPASALPIVAMSIRRPGLEATAERKERGAWRLTTPVRFPADAARIEKALTAVTTLQVDPGSGGFVADRVRDFTPYGLEPPTATLELRSPAAGSEPIILMVGSKVPDHPEQVYVRKGGRDDVMAVDARFLAEIPADLKGLRSRFVAEIVPTEASRIEIDAAGGPIQIVRDKLGWWLKSPVEGRADRGQVEALLKGVEDLQASEFFDPAILSDSGVDPPLRRLRIWQGEGVIPGHASEEAEPAVSLAIGRYDVLRKVVFARADGDSAILALPDTFLKVLPTSSLAFRDRDLPAVAPMSVSRLTIVRPGRTTVLEPDTAGDPNRWRMVQPAKAAADVRAVTAALARLAELRATEFVADLNGDLARYGLNRPIFEIRWETVQPAGTPPAPKRLRIGSALPNKPSIHYGTLSDFPAVFTIEAESLLPFAAEFHETRALSFRPPTVRRLMLRTETRNLAYSRRAQRLGTPADWSAEKGTPTQSVDLSRFDNLIEGLSELRAARFVQYQGPFPPGAGLEHPRLRITVEFVGDAAPVRLRLGSKFLGDWVCAAVGDENSGPVFLLQAPVWEDLIRVAEGGLPPIPDSFIAPAPSP